MLRFAVSQNLSGGSVRCSATPQRYRMVQKLMCSRFSSDTASTSSSGDKKGGGSGRFLLYTLGAATVGTAGGVAYARFDPEFRKSVEDKVPYAKEALDSVLGPPADSQHSLRDALPSIPGSEALTDLKHKVKDIIPKRKEPGHTEVVSMMRKPEPVASAPVPAESPKAAETKAAVEAGKDLQLKQQIQKEDNEKRRLNKVMEERVNASLESARSKVNAALESKTAVVTAIEYHTKLLRQAVDDPKDPHWLSVSTAFSDLEYSQRADKPREADASNYLGSLRTVINDGRAHKATADNALLNTVAEQLNKLAFELEEAKARVGQAQRESKIMAEYKTLTEQSRKHFANELKSILPSVDIHAKENTLTVDELNSLIAHAHLRVDELRRQLTDQQLREQQNIDAAVDRLRAENKRATEEQLEREKERLGADLKVDAERKLVEQKQQSEEELRAQLRRSAAAHSEHLEEVLRVQKERLDMLKQRDVDEALLKERQNFHRDISGSMARLQGIESALESRATQDAENRKSKELWLACQNLVESVVHGRKGGIDVETRRRPLANELMGIKEASRNDAFVNVMVNSIADEALHSGVYTQEDLRSRFHKVRKLCRRTSMIGDNGGTLWQYFMSGVQSMFMFDSSKEYPSDDNVDPQNLDTFSVLSRADYAIEERADFEEAIRLMLLLRGQPARIAADWIRDARLHLETLQTAHMLLTHAAATGLRTVY